MNPDRGLIRQHSSRLDFLFRCADCLIIIFSLRLMFALRGVAPGLLSKYYLLGLVAAVAYLVSAEAIGLYRARRGATIDGEFRLVFQTWLVVVPAILLLGYVTKMSADYSRQAVLSWALLAPLLLCLWRIIVRHFLAEARRHGRNTRTAAVVGVGDMARQVADAIVSNPEAGLNLVGVYDDGAEVGSKPFPNVAASVVGSVDELIARGRAGSVDHVYVALSLASRQRIDSLIDQLSDSTVSLFIVPDLFFFELLRTRWTALGDLPLLSVYDVPLYGVDGWVKRAEDLVLGTIFLAVAAVPLALIALAIRLTSGGPVLFKQHRYGIDGKHIVVWKFRTMTVCDDGPEVVQATADDARVTRLGGWLRRTSLDELPQLINVLQGRMSLVGPRPHAVAHNEQYRKLIHGYMLRHKVRPGITGWAQVNGLRGQTDTLEKMEKRVSFDLEYIRNWSLGFDLKIILRTAITGFVGRNAY